MFAELALALATSVWAISATAVAVSYRRHLHTDPISGIRNRTALFRVAEKHCRKRRPVGLLLLDLDHFKAINDTYGHAFGNVVLAAVGDRLARSARCGELAVRLHGDEFALWLGPVDHWRDAERRAREISSALAEPIAVGNRELTLTTSVGYGIAPAAAPLGDLLGRADARMYRVKVARDITAIPRNWPQVHDSRNGGDQS